ncbi:GNAT family N-acetyltransferase [Aestuariivirga sp.]|uniref:GNAT family N-acetyltransferase n=1 Tax=Aestuariivirga sp. TaxID=2650926 RepID=UPI0039E4B35C
MILQTERLVLSPCTPADKADFMALERDPEVMLFLNGGHPVDSEQGDPNSLFLMPRGAEDHLWTARRKDNGAFVGWFYFGPEQEEREAELGYRLRRAEWGQGFASEAALELVNWGFRSRRYDRAVACTMAANAGSRRVLEKIGFRHVRTDFVDWADYIPGGDEGEVWYELLRTEWAG